MSKLETKNTEPAATRGTSSSIYPSGISSQKLLVRDKQRSSRFAESIIGIDDRVRILDTNEAPWRMICSLHIKAGHLSFRGTGWLSGPRTVITAGHCVYDDQAMEGWATEIVVTPGRDQDDAPFGSVKSSRFSTVKGWLEDKNPDEDFGAIHLDEAIGEATGWFPIASPQVEDLDGLTVNISGYPADRGFGVEQYHHKNQVLDVTEERLFYEVDTYGGQSGSPVFTIDRDGLPKVIGIHAYGVGGTPTHLGITANSGPRVNQQVARMISKWS